MTGILRIEHAIVPWIEASDGVSRCRAVAATKPLVPNVSGPEGFAIWAARVSNPESQAAGLNADRLFRYLVRKKHWSPLDMASIAVEVITPRDIARQQLRTRRFDIQEFSQRYAKAPGWVRRRARRQDPVNRQSSHDDLPVPVTWAWSAGASAVWALAWTVYTLALKAGVAKETARTVLPEGLTVSRLIVSGSLRTWLHYLQSRTDESAQEEHRALALAILEAIRPIAPSVAAQVRSPE